MRLVVETEFTLKGAYLTLHCNHVKWIGGLKPSDPRPGQSECMEGPCLKLVKFCGVD